MRVLNLSSWMGLNPLFGGSAFRTYWSDDLLPYRVLIPFLAGLLFGRRDPRLIGNHERLNPLFGGSAFRTR